MDRLEAIMADVFTYCDTRPYVKSASITFARLDGELSCYARVEYFNGEETTISKYKPTGKAVEEWATTQTE